MLTTITHPRYTQHNHDNSISDQYTPEDRALIQLGQELKTLGYRFTTVTPATHARVNSRTGNAWATKLEDVFGWSRPFQSDVLPPAVFELMQCAGIAAPHEGGWRSRVRASTLDGRLFFHSAYPTTDADAVFFGPDTYRFISAIEQQCHNAAMPVRRIVDIGCGAGPAAIWLADRYPDAEVLAADINAYALRLTRINAALAQVSNVHACHSNLLKDINGQFDLIVANPPYLVDPQERTYRHGGGALGAGLSLDIVNAALPRLNPQGNLLLYTGAAIINGHDAFLADIEELLADTGCQWRYRESDPDVFGEELTHAPYDHADRIAVVVLTVTK